MNIVMIRASNSAVRIITEVIILHDGWCVGGETGSDPIIVKLNTELVEVPDGLLKFEFDTKVKIESIFKIIKTNNFHYKK